MRLWWCLCTYRGGRASGRILSCLEGWRRGRLKRRDRPGEGMGIGAAWLLDLGMDGREVCQRSKISPCGRSGPV